MVFRPKLLPLLCDLVQTYNYNGILVLGEVLQLMFKLWSSKPSHCDWCFGSLTYSNNSLQVMLYCRISFITKKLDMKLSNHFSGLMKYADIDDKYIIGGRETMFSYEHVQNCHHYTWRHCHHCSFPFFHCSNLFAIDCHYFHYNSSKVLEPFWQMNYIWRLVCMLLLAVMGLWPS